MRDFVLNYAPVAIIELDELVTLADYERAGSDTLHMPEFALPARPSPPPPQPAIAPAQALHNFEDAG